MKSSAKNVKLTSVDDLFTTEESRIDEQREKVVEIPLSEIHPFENHPFKVMDDDRMLDMAASIREHGVLVPGLVRPREDGGYEMVAGHRRHRASELAERETMPVIIRELDDDAATIIMVDSNIQRETLLPSERAWAYRMKLDALRRKAGRPSKENTGQLDPNFDNRRSNVIVAEQAGESVKQVQRFIRLTELIPELMNLVDEKKIAFTLPLYRSQQLRLKKRLSVARGMSIGCGMCWKPSRKIGSYTLLFTLHLSARFVLARLSASTGKRLISATEACGSPVRCSVYQTDRWAFYPRTRSFVCFPSSFPHPKAA